MTTMLRHPGWLRTPDEAADMKRLIIEAVCEGVMTPLEAGLWVSIHGLRSA